MKTIASHNGPRAAELAYTLLTRGQTPLDAVVEGVTLVEDDPEELTVGYGGLPNEEGVVELDAAVMDGPTHRGAGVAALRNVRHPTKVARLLWEQTHRVLLVGEGALAFARANGFVEENLLTDKARRMWLHWKRTRSRIDDWRPPAGEHPDLDLERWFHDYFYARLTPEGRPAGSDATRPPPPGGTVHCAALSPTGDLACATSTSGHAFKLAGRVGDSPILGAGLYVDNDVGSCGSIGHGEANLENLSSFFAVECLRTMPPREAGLAALRRAAARAHPEQRDAQGRPRFNLQLYLLAKNGEHAGVALWGPKQIAVVDAAGSRLEACVALWERSE